MSLDCRALIRDRSDPALCMWQVKYLVQIPPLDLRGLTQLTDLSLSDGAVSEVHVWFPSGLRSLSMRNMLLAPDSWQQLARTCRHLECLDCLIDSMPPISPQSLPRLQDLGVHLSYSGAVVWAAELASRSQKAYLSLYSGVDATPLGQPAFHGLQLDTLNVDGCPADVWQNLSVRNLHVSKFSGTCINAAMLPPFLSSGQFTAMHADSMTVDLTGCASLQGLHLIVKGSCRLQLNGNFQVQYDREADLQLVTFGCRSN